MQPLIGRRRAMQLGLAASSAVLLGCENQGQSVPGTETLTAEPAGKFANHEILMLVYPRFTALDLIGPQHVFSLLGPEFKTRLVWKSKERVTSDTGIPVFPTMSFEECTENPTVLFIPGGTDGTIAALEDPEVRAFVAARGAQATYVTSVCTGAFVLGAAGLLRGYKATTHWLALQQLSTFGAQPVAERVVIDRNRITGAGVTAGIDFALELAAKLQDDGYAKAIQLMMEYDPQPPFDSGNPTAAEPESVRLLEAMAVPFHDDLAAAAERIQGQ